MRDVQLESVPCGVDCGVEQRPAIVVTGKSADANPSLVPFVITHEFGPVVIYVCTAVVKILGCLGFREMNANDLLAIPNIGQAKVWVISSTTSSAVILAHSVLIFGNDTRSRMSIPSEIGFKESDTEPKDR